MDGEGWEEEEAIVRARVGGGVESEMGNQRRRGGSGRRGRRETVGKEYGENKTKKKFIMHIRWLSRCLPNYGQRFICLSRAINGSQFL
jgi:hypothetical protein